MERPGFWPEVGSLPWRASFPKPQFDEVRARFVEHDMNGIPRLAMYMELSHSVTTGADDVTQVGKRLDKHEGKAERPIIHNAAKAVNLKETCLVGVEANARVLHGLHSAMLSSG